MAQIANGEKLVQITDGSCDLASFDVDNRFVEQRFDGGG